MTDVRSKTNAATRRGFIDPAAIMQIKNLSLRAKSVVEGFMTGLHRSPVHGFSVEFSEYRPYVVGDDTRNLDWKLLARTDRYYIKKFEDETNRRCYIAVDQSRSMSYGTRGYSKAEYARTLAATFAYYLTLQRDAVGVFTCGNDRNQFIPPRHKPGHLQQLMQLLSKESVGRKSDLEVALSDLAAQSKRRGLVVLLSDLLVEPADLLQPLGYLAGRGHETVLIRVLDPREVDFELEHGSVIQDLESGREIFVDSAQVRADYRRRFAEHESQLIDICHKRNARFLTVTTDQPLDAALRDLVGLRTSRRATDLGSKQAGRR